MNLRRTQKLFLGLGALCLLVLIGLAALFSGPLRSHEPVYDGVTLSAWLDQLWPIGYPRPTGARNDRAVRAVRSIGTNAIPWLLTDLNAGRNRSLNHLERVLIRYKVLRVADPIIRENRAVAGFAVLNELAASAVPDLRKMLEKDPTHQSALASLAYIGKPALPALAQCLTNTTPIQTPSGLLRPVPGNTMACINSSLHCGKLSARDLAPLLPSINAWALQTTNGIVALWATNLLNGLAHDPSAKVE